MKKILLFLFLLFPLGDVSASELEETCKKLSSENEFEYEAIVGKVTGYTKYPPPNYECFHGEGCPPLNQSVFFFSLHAIDVKGLNEGDFFSIYTDYVPDVSGSYSASYMFEGGIYQFCGRRVDWYEYIHMKRDNRTIFKVDYINTIDVIMPPDLKE